MRISNLIGKRYKERPSEATLESHSILLRGGYIRQVANGIYSLLPLGLRVIRKIEAIVREEMDAIDGQEVRMPVVLPRELWEESGRYSDVGPELLRLSDRTGHGMVLAMTHEEGVVHLVRNEVASYKDYPFMLYQIQTKFRDEPRSRGGLIRVREFTMKDGYSFHTDQDDLETYYREVETAYSRIFSRVGLPEVLEVQSDTGMMGGKIAHEYMLLTDAGEDTIVKCTRCDYVANLEVATGQRQYLQEEERELEKVATPDMKTIEAVSQYLEVPPEQTAKAVFYETDGNGLPVLVLIRGDLEVNETKLAKIIMAEPVDALEETILQTGAVPGFASGMDLRDCRVIADVSVDLSSNLVTGANLEDHHYLNFNLRRDLPDVDVVDIAKVRETDRCPECDSLMRFARGIEVGNIFQLGTQYTTAMGMRYLDKDGKERVPVMGCYGIGVSRLVGAIAEVRNDKYGPIWPAAVAPFDIHMVCLKLEAAQSGDFSEPAYQALTDAGYDVVLDDRDERPGVKFADADLIGAPLRLVFSARNYDKKEIEWKTRSGDGEGVLAYEDLLSFVSGYFSSLETVTPGM